MERRKLDLSLFAGPVCQIDAIEGRSGKDILENTHRDGEDLERGCVELSRKLNDLRRRGIQSLTIVFSAREELRGNWPIRTDTGGTSLPRREPYYHSC